VHFRLFFLGILDIKIQQEPKISSKTRERNQKPNHEHLNKEMKNPRSERGWPPDALEVQGRLRSVVAATSAFTWCHGLWWVRRATGHG
jgi:hypothetical protein